MTKNKRWKAWIDYLTYIKQKTNNKHKLRLRLQQKLKQRQMQMPQMNLKMVKNKPFKLLRKIRENNIMINLTNMMLMISMIVMAADFDLGFKDVKIIVITNI